MQHCLTQIELRPFKPSIQLLTRIPPPGDLDLGDSSSLFSIRAHNQAISLVLMFCSALAIRLILALCVFRDVAAPSIDHNQFGWEMGWTARSIALGHGFGSPFLPWTGPTALVPPLFPYLLAGIFKLFGLYTAKSALVILSLDSIFSALTCLPIFFIAKHSLGLRAARLAGWGWVIYPYAIFFSGGIVWDYALTALLFSICFWMAQKLHLHTSLAAWVGFGALFAVTILSNPSVGATLPFLLLIALLKVRRVGGRWLLNGLVTALTFTAILAPWTLRNYRALHVVSPIRDGFWLEFWAGNNGDTSDSNPPSAHPASNPVEMQKYQSAGEVAYFAQKRTMALDFVKQHPLFFVGVSMRRIVRFWTGLWSFEHSYLQREPLDVPNFFFCTTLTLFMLRGVRRWWRIDHAPRFATSSC